MAIDAKFTRTLPAPTATISSGFVFLLSAGWFTDADLGAAGSPIGGGANSIANGGGDMQIFSDTGTTTRLPIEVVTFVTGGSPEAQVWVRTPSYTSGDTITIGRDDTQTTQPAVGAAFGRDATWVDFHSVIHANETGTNGVFVDSTGNGHDTTLTTGATLSTTTTGNPFGESWPDFTTAEVVTLTDSYQAVNNTAFTLSCWMNGDTTSDFNGLFGSRYNAPDNQWTGIQTSGRCFSKSSSVENLADASQSTGVTRLLKLKQNTSSLDNVANGSIVSQDLSVTDGEAINNITASHDFRVGTYFDNLSSRRYSGRAAEFRIKQSKDSVAYDDSEYDNQNDPDNFGTSSEWVLVGGGGISITATLGSIDYSSQNAIVQLTGSVDVVATLGAISYGSQDATIQLSGEIDVSATLGAIDYTSQNTTVQLSGELLVNATLGQIDYTSNNVAIDLSGDISVSAGLGQIDYSSQDTVVTLQGNIVVPVTLGQITYDSKSVVVSIGEGQVIGVVTAGFANDLYSSNFKPDDISIQFKPDTITVTFKS